MTTYTDSSWATALSHLLGSADGDIVQLTNGSYDVGSSVATLDKTDASAEVTFKAQNRGGAVLTNRGINLTGAKITVEGFDMQFGTASSSVDIIAVNGDDCRMTRNRITATNPGSSVLQKWIHDKANNFIFDYNYVYGKRCIDDMFLMDKSTTVAISGCQILHNYFYDFVQLPGDTRSEVIRIGQSTMAMMDFDAEIAYNRIEQCDADTEVISVKASNVNIHHNTLVDTLGSIVLRQAHNCRVKYNNIFGDNGMIRLYGHGHEVEYNQLFGTSIAGVASPVWIGSADLEEYEITTGVPAVAGDIIPSNSNYARTKNCKISHNIIDNGNSLSDSFIKLGDNNDGSNLRQLQPINNEIKYNYIVASDGDVGEARGGSFPASWSLNDVSNNMFSLTGSATDGDFPTSGYVVGVLPLLKHPDGTYRCVYRMGTDNTGPDAP